MDEDLQKCFTSGNFQLFIGSGLSKGLYPDADALRNRLMDMPIYTDGRQTTIRAVLGSPAEIALDDAAEFYEVYKGGQALVNVIKGIYGTAR